MHGTVAPGDCFRYVDDGPMYFEAPSFDWEFNEPKIDTGGIAVVLSVAGERGARLLLPDGMIIWSYSIFSEHWDDWWVRVA